MTTTSVRAPGALGVALATAGVVTLLLGAVVGVWAGERQSGEVAAHLVPVLVGVGGLVGAIRSSAAIGFIATAVLTVMALTQWANPWLWVSVAFFVAALGGTILEALRRG